MSTSTTDAAPLSATPGDACIAALAHERFATVRHAIERRADAPQTPKAWFDFCAGYMGSPTGYALLHAIKQEALGGPVEVFVALNSLIVASDRIEGLPFSQAIRDKFFLMCREIAAMEAHWLDHFDVDEPRFVDVTQLVSLSRFLAGELAFAYGHRLPYNFVFRSHPVQVFSLLRQQLGPMRGAAPFLSLHFNYARRNRLIVSQLEFERALWRLAKLLERDPRQTGIVSSAWFHSTCVRDAFPRLAWMRDIFIAGGAYAIDLEPGHEEDICYNSAKRKELYEAGQFAPRHTLILWPRDSVLAWAASRPELADPGEAPIDAAAIGGRRSIASPAPQPCARHNSKVQLWDGRAVRQRYGVKYFAALIGAPGVLAALAAGSAGGWGWSLPTFMITAYVMAALQYFVTQ